MARIVGRDTQRLDRAGVTRAAVETVAENFSDGVAAPLFYFFLGGAPLALCYKAINTMDSMVGYRNERYLYFGRWAARLDDGANWLPARLSALLLVAAAAWGRMGGAWRIWRRDRQPASPNAAQMRRRWPSAGGSAGRPAWYFGIRVKTDHWHISAVVQRIFCAVTGCSMGQRPAWRSDGLRCALGGRRDWMKGRAWRVWAAYQIAMGCPWTFPPM
ncbi:MAG: CobD/CbiB family cobalamin biosynthesis protein [Evtepia gabavorous]